MDVGGPLASLFPLGEPQGMHVVKNVSKNLHVPHFPHNTIFLPPLGGCVLFWRHSFSTGWKKKNRQPQFLPLKCCFFGVVFVF